ncbi:MAG TPA: DegV family protein [Candidatus Avacidaminococcus intestinavium]|uniref:DegV family protein n=1 Tax=Candidatus Avacidaminococcus intestinavium TaxID=2840684 RepID=A0A9D1MRA3_9FIRM|nr:DegV family protein [Candidatus Avacidaminococcus intestinavium]
MRDDIHIVLDSIAIMKETVLSTDPRCHEICLSVRHGDIEWRDGEKTLAEMFQMVKATGELPKTSQPPLGEFLELFTDLSKQGKKVLMLALDGVLSGTVETARLAARQVMASVPGADIRVVDSLTAAVPISGMAMAILEALESGIDLDEAEEYARDLALRTETYFTVNTLDYLQKGGRIGAVGALFGNLLGIRPIVYLDKTGALTIADKVRTRSKTLKRMIELATEHAPFEAMYVAHAEAHEEAEKVKQQLAEMYKDIPIMMTGIGTVLASHLGPGTIGIFLRRKK